MYLTKRPWKRNAILGRVYIVGLTHTKHQGQKSSLGTFILGEPQETVINYSHYTKLSYCLEVCVCVWVWEVSSAEAQAYYDFIFHLGGFLAGICKHTTWLRDFRSSVVFRRCCNLGLPYILVFRKFFEWNKILEARE